MERDPEKEINGVEEALCSKESDKDALSDRVGDLDADRMSVDDTLGLDKEEVTPAAYDFVLRVRVVL